MWKRITLALTVLAVIVTGAIVIPIFLGALGMDIHFHW